MNFETYRPKGRRYYNLLFTDPSTHEQVKRSTKKTTKTEADAWAFQFVKAYEPGESGRLTVGDLVEGHLAVLEIEKPTRYEKAKYAWETRMKDKFAHIDAREFQGEHTKHYIHWAIGVKKKQWKPLATPLAKATANRDVAVLQGAYTYAKTVKSFSYRPYFHVHDESDNVREGFLEQHEFDACTAVIKKMGSPFLWLWALLTMAYECGNRRGELQTLKVSQFNRIDRIIRLKGRDTKTGKPREVGCSDELYALLTVCCEGKQPEDYIFTRMRRWKRDGKYTGLSMGQVGDFRKLWRGILTEVGIYPGRDVLLHDFRRSAVTNMIQADVDRDEIRQHTGHSESGMASMISRYHMLKRERVLDVAKRVEAYKQEQRKKAAKVAARQQRQAEQAAGVIQ